MTSAGHDHDPGSGREIPPALVIGVPAGFVGAAEAKDALRRSGLPSLSNVSEKGGPVVAAAAADALFGLAHDSKEEADA